MTARYFRRYLRGLAGLLILVPATCHTVRAAQPPPALSVSGSDKKIADGILEYCRSNPVDDTSERRRSLNEALAIYRSLNSERESLEVLRLQSSFLRITDETEAFAREVVSLGERIDTDALNRASDCLSLAIVLYYRIPYGKGTYEESDSWAQRASRLAQSGNNPKGWQLRESIFSFLAVSQGLRGNRAESVRLRREAGKYASLAGNWLLAMHNQADIAEEVLASGRLALAYTLCDETLKAIESRLSDMGWVTDWHQVEALQNLQSRMLEAQSGIAGIFSDTATSEQKLLSALRASRNSGLDRYAILENTRAEHLLRQGRVREAGAVHEFLVKVSPEYGDTMTYATTRFGYINFLKQTKRYGEALRMLDEVRNSIVSKGFLVYLDECEYRRGKILLMSGRPREALAGFQAAWNLISGYELPDAKWRISLGQSEVFQALEQPHQAYDAAVRAVREAERYLDRCAYVALSSGSPLSGYETAYQQAFEASLGVGLRSEAFRYAEKSRFRLLQEALRSGGNSSAVRLPVYDSAEFRKLREQWSSAHGALIRAHNDRGASQAMRKALQLRLDDINRALDAAHLRLALDRGAVDRVGKTSEYAQWGDLRSLAASLNATILYYVWSRDSVYLICAGPRDIRLLRLSEKPAVLEKLAGVFQRQAGSPYGELAPVNALKLYSILIAPVEREIRASRRLILLPDGPLWDVPFAALATRRNNTVRYLVQTHELVYAPSATVLRNLLRTWPGDDARSVGSKPRIAVISNPAPNPLFDGARQTGMGRIVQSQGLPELPFTATETRSIKDLYGARAVAFDGPRATVESSVTALNEYDIAHFATHAVFVPQSALNSGLILAPGKGNGRNWYLDARTIAATPIRARLVVYSACDSGRGRVAGGEGLLGLTWATFVGGARCQVASKWAVRDEAGARLMADFHRELNRTGAPAKALRAAQIKALNRPGSRPFLWAGFICIGAGTRL